MRSGQPSCLCALFCSAQRTTALSQAPGSSDSTLILARTSPLRLVSWVDSVSIVSGQRLAAWAMAWWNSAGAPPNRLGSPPTSLRLISGWYR